MERLPSYKRPFSCSWCDECCFWRPMRMHRAAYAMQFCPSVRDSWCTAKTVWNSPIISCDLFYLTFDWFSAVKLNIVSVFHFPRLLRCSSVVMNCADSMHWRAHYKLHYLMILNFDQFSADCAARNYYTLYSVLTVMSLLISRLQWIKWRCFLFIGGSPLGERLLYVAAVCLPVCRILLFHSHCRSLGAVAPSTSGITLVLQNAVYQERTSALSYVSAFVPSTCYNYILVRLLNHCV